MLDLAHLVIVVVGSMLNHLFLDQSIEFLPEETFMKNREKPWKAQKLVSYQEYLATHPRMDLRLWYRNLTALAADTLPKRAIVDMETSAPFTTQASMDFHCDTEIFHQAGWSPL